MSTNSLRDPKALRFTRNHEWVAEDGTVGVSGHAQEEIADVVFVELPNAGRVVKAGEACVVVESVKAAFDIHAPVGGILVAVNSMLTDDPAAVNRSPYGEGWLVRIQMTNPSERDSLMTFEQYEVFATT